MYSAQEYCSRAPVRCYDLAPPESLTIDPVEIEEDGIRFFVPQAHFVAPNGVVYETEHTYESIGVLYSEAEVREICEIPIIHFRVNEDSAVLVLGRTPKAHPRSIRSARTENAQIAPECQIDSFYLTLYKKKSRVIEIPSKRSEYDINALLREISQLKAENARLHNDIYQLQKVNVGLGVARINNPNKESVAL